MWGIRDVLQGLGMSGDASGTGGCAARTLSYSYAAVAVTAGIVNTINVITIQHANPQNGLAAVVWEGSSLITLLAFLWIAWIGYRIAPPAVRPRWKLLVHVPAALLFSLAHVGGFVGLRKLAYWLAGSHYDFGAFASQFRYELSKDALGYAFFVAVFSLVQHLLRRPASVEARPSTFDIRDGAKLVRVSLDHVLAVSSAGNYVEFALEDGRRILMRSPLSALEKELGPRGFVRTHRSWLVNARRMTVLSPEGSGDYTVELGQMTVPLSRRFPEALVRLRNGGGVFS
jgi:LytTr DNA-binding domain